MTQDELQEAFERGCLIKVYTLLRNGHWQAAQEILENWYENHRAEDVGGLLENHTWVTRALILEDRGEYSAAVDAYRQVRWPPENAPAYLVNASSLAFALLRLGRQIEAKDAIEHALDNVRGHAPELYVHLLAKYAEISGGIPARWGSLIEELARGWQLLEPGDRLDEPDDRRAVTGRLEQYVGRREEGMRKSHEGQ